VKTTIVVVAAEAVAIAAVLIVALDLREHGRVAPLGGVNEWGYRGAVAHLKKANEVRTVVVGGTRAFGWGQPASALVAEMRRVVMLTTDRAGAPDRPIVVLNLGRLGAAPASYPDTLAHYAYLRPDYVCLFDDLGVAGGVPTSGTDGTSGVFQLTGYAPALPLVAREKGMLWRYGDVRSGYVAAAERRGPSAPFVRRTAGAVLESIGGLLQAADRGLARLVDSSPRSVAPSSDANSYAGDMVTAIEAAYRSARGVVVVLSPPETAQQQANRAALTSRLAPLGGASWLRIVDLGADRELVSEPSMRVDGWNYSSSGVARVANVIAPALLSLITGSGVL
jgi:hypothetical protein